MLLIILKEIYILYVHQNLHKRVNVIDNCNIFYNYIKITILKYLSFIV